MPLVSIVMSTHNDAPYLPAALASLWGQSFTDFELIVIDDGSTDATPQILAACTDERLVKLHNPQNLGLTLSLNRGLAVAQGRYIARMDADDLAIPAQRLAHQVAYMEAHPEVGCLSGDMLAINPNGEFLDEGKPFYGKGASHHYLTWRMLWGCPLSHITIMLRRDVLLQHGLTYRPDFNTAEDYELWATLTRVTQLVRLPEVWAYRRVLTTSVSHVRLAEQLALMQQLMAREMTYLLGTAPDPDGLQALFNLLHLSSTPPLYVRAGVDLLMELYHAFLQKYPLTTEDRREVEGDVVGYLLKLNQRASTSQAALYALWRLRQVSRREFYSRNALRLAFKPLLKLR